MKKYLETMKLLFKSQLTYRFDILMNIIFSITKILLAYVLWSAIYNNSHEVAGFTFDGMMSYYIISTFMAQLNQSTSTGWQISAEIRRGLFSKYMVRPMSIFGYFSAHTSGVALFFISFNLLAAVLWTLLFGVDIVLTAGLQDILLAGGLILLGLLFMMQLNYYIGILAFKFLDTGLFMMIKDNILEFVAGTFIPLTLLSEKVLLVMKYFPFYYVTYLPTMVLMGRNAYEAPMGLVMLVVWNLFLWALNAVTWSRLKVKYDGVGI